jgi:ADP-heptose:LPS heptosyltransferase
VKQERVVVVALMTFGDFVLMIPFLQALRHKHPLAEISIICGSRGYALAKDYPWLDRVLDLSDLKSPSRLWNFATTAWGLFRSKTIYALHPIFRSAVIAYLLGGRDRVGFDQATTYLYSSRRRFEEVPSVSSFQQKLIRNILLNDFRSMRTARGHASARFFQLIPGGDSYPLRACMRTRYAEARRSDSHLIILAPYSGWLPRNWPLENWVELARELRSSYPASSVAISVEPKTKEEVTLAFQALEGIQILCPGSDFDALFDAFAQASLVVANDSFPLHLATVLDVPSVGLFGPNLPEWFGGCSTKNANLHKRVECSPCVQRRGEERCLQGLVTCAGLSSLPIEEVTASCVKILGENQRANKSS